MASRSLSGKNVATEFPNFERLKTKWTEDTLPGLEAQISAWRTINTEVFAAWQGDDQKAYENQFNGIVAAINAMGTTVETIFNKIAASMSELEREETEAAQQIRNVD